MVRGGSCVGEVGVIGVAGVPLERNGCPCGGMRGVEAVEK